MTTFASLYVPDELGDAVSGRAWLAAMLETERALARAGALAGVVPDEAASVIAAACDVERYDWETLLGEGRSVGNPAEPLVRALVDLVGEDAGRYVHLGATSQDVVDTAAMLVARDASASCSPTSGASPRQRRPSPVAPRHADGGTDDAPARRAHDVRPQGRRVARRGAGCRHAPLGRSRERSRRTARRRGRDAGGARRSGARRLRALRAELGLAEATLPWHTNRVRVAELGAALALVCGVA